MFHRLFHRPIRAPQEGRPAGCWSSCCWRAVSRCRLSMPGPRTCRRARRHAALRRSATARHRGRLDSSADRQHGRQPGHPDGTVLAVRSVTLSSIGTLVPAARRTGTTWRPERRGPGLAGRQHRLSLECAGIGIRLRAGPEANATEVPAATEIRAIQNSEQLAMRTGVHLAGVEVLTGLRVELVKLGSDVLPGIGAFPVTGMATGYQGARMRFKIVQVKSQPVAEGTDLGPIMDPCNASFDFNIDQLISGAARRRRL